MKNPNVVEVKFGHKTNNISKQWYESFPIATSNTAPRMYRLQVSDNS